MDNGTEVVKELIAEQKSSCNTIKTRTYFFTINNFTDEVEQKFKEVDSVYKVYQIEKGKNGTEHIQGVIYFKNPRAFNGVKKLFPTAHIEGAKNFKKVRNYCMKEDTRVRGPYEIGTIPDQGNRCDLKDIKDQIMNGDITVEQILVENPELYHQYGRTLNELETVYKNKQVRNDMTQGFWLWGETGSGKSHTARLIADGDSTYNHPTRDKGWWDNYEQQTVVIIDDFRGEIEYNELLKLVDKWPHSVSRRGKKPINFTSQCVIITSSLPPELIYKKREAEDSIEQLLRRFEVRELKKKA